MPRWALWCLCLAYLLPGFVGRDPWKQADIAAFGQMLGIARGWTSAWHPAVAGLHLAGGGLFPYWLGAGFIQALPWMDPALAARLPFAGLLGLVLLLVWYSTYHLARTDAAQPLPLAFGGEAKSVDYARSVADGGLLAMVATLGLLQLGHETTPELLQLAGAALHLFAMSACTLRPNASRISTILGLSLMAGSGSPTVAAVLAASSVGICRLSQDEPSRNFSFWVALAGATAAVVGAATHTWAWRITWAPSGPAVLRSLIWFPWPASPFAIWTLWRWRGHLTRKHIAVPASVAATGVAAFLLMDGSDRSLLLSLPGFAVLAAFALPTFKRSLSAAIDWFSVFFFTACTIGIWVVYSALQTGYPAKTAANIAKLAAPGFRSHFSWPALFAGIAGTVAWIAVVRWRTSRNPRTLWKCMVLPASGVTVCWLMLMSLWLPPLDHARSYRSQIERISKHVPMADCVLAPDANAGLLTAWQYFAHTHVVGGPAALDAGCNYLLVNVPAKAATPIKPQWRPIARERQRGANTDALVLYQRRKS